MIIVLEACLGNDKVVVQHIQKALALLQSWCTQYPDRYNSALAFTSPTPSVIEMDLIRDFDRLELQSLSTLDAEVLSSPDFFCGGQQESQQRAEKEYLVRSTELVREMPKPFADLTDARKYLEVILKSAIIMKRIAHLMGGPGAQSLSRGSSLALFPPSSPWTGGSYYSFSASPAEQTRLSLHQEELLRYQDGYLSALAQWETSFRDITALTCRAEIRDSPEVLKLRFHGIFTRIALVAAVSFNQTLFDDFTSDFKEAIAIARILLESTGRDQSVPSLGFTFNLGVVMPLWLVGCKCRLPDVRREAIRLLRAYPRREGVWDSLLAAGMIEFVIRIEREHQTRMEGILWSFNSNKRTATFTCQLRQSPQSLQLITRRKTLAW